MSGSRETVSFPPSGGAGGEGVPGSRGGPGRAGVAPGGGGVDLDMMTRIRDEGFHRSQVMETAAQLTDVIGPRLTGSPAQRRASEWTRKQLEDWGLSNARLEPWGRFGRGWSFDRATISLVAPEQAPLLALPEGLDARHDGPQRARAVKARLESEADLEKWKGQLRGAIAAHWRAPGPEGAVREVALLLRGPARRAGAVRGPRALRDDRSGRRRGSAGPSCARSGSGWPTRGPWPRSSPASATAAPCASWAAARASPASPRA